MTTAPESPRRARWTETLAVYLRPRVLIVMFLGFSSGLPLALSGSTLLVWMREAGVDLGTIGLFALVGTPYTIKFLWAPLVDALDVPVLSRLLGRRRGWLVFSQLLLMAATVFLALHRSREGAVAGRVRRADGRDRLRHAGHRDRRVPRRDAAAERAGRRHGVLCRGLSHRHADLDRRRAVPRHRLRELRPRQERRLDRRLSGDGGLRADRHRDDAARDRAGQVGRRHRGSRRACRARTRSAACGAPRTARSRNSSRARWRSSCCSSSCSTSSATHSPAR